jgi:hypothetical protein
VTARIVEATGRGDGLGKDIDCKRKVRIYVLAVWTDPRKEAADSVIGDRIGR